jgi:hypothetical protein
VLDEVFVNDPEPAVRWRAARAVVKYCRGESPPDVVEFLRRALLDPDEHAAIKAACPRLNDGLFWQRTVTAVGRLTPEVAGPPLLTLFRRKRDATYLVGELIRIGGPWRDGQGQLRRFSPIQREILAAIAELPDTSSPGSADPPGWSLLSCRHPLSDVGLPATRQGLLDLLAGKPEPPAAH